MWSKLLNFKAPMIVFIIIVGAFYFNSLYNFKLYKDDIVNTEMVKPYSLSGFVHFFYCNYDGRWFNQVVLYILFSFIVVSPELILLFQLCLFLIAAFYTGKLLARIIGNEHNKFLNGLFVLCCWYCFEMKDETEVFLWLTSLSIYMLSTLFVLVLLNIVFNESVPFFEFAAAIILSACLGGLSESASILLLLVFAFLFFNTIITVKNKNLIIWMSIACILGLVINYVAPGRQIRAESIVHLSKYQHLKNSIHSFVWPFEGIGFWLSKLVAFVSVVCFFRFNIKQRFDFKILVQITLLLFLITLGIFGLVSITLSDVVPARVSAILHLFWLVLFGILATSFIRKGKTAVAEG